MNNTSIVSKPSEYRERWGIERYVEAIALVSALSVANNGLENLSQDQLSNLGNSNPDSLSLLASIMLHGVGA